jgi:hypothetical protein
MGAWLFNERVRAEPEAIQTRDRKSNLSYQPSSSQFASSSSQLILYFDLSVFFKTETKIRTIDKSK